MQRFIYIVGLACLFLMIGLLFSLTVSEALPIIFIGGCVGWAIAELKKEIHQNKQMSSQSE